jgi:septum formation inhibitor MinC
MHGAKGNKKAIIAASLIETPQIRIANIIKELEKEDTDKAYTLAYIENDKFILK